MLDRNKLEEIKREAAGKIGSSLDDRTLAETKSLYLGRKGIVPGLLKLMPQLAAEERKLFGSLVNEVKDHIEKLVEDRSAWLKEEEKKKKLSEKNVDVTLPGRKYHGIGSIHPITQVIGEVTGIFAGMGFDVAEGPEIESDYYNFQALNIPPEHPARDMQDTFYTGAGVLLRTHTSPVQIRVMKAQRPPLRVICPGKVYRRDMDITHSPMFHQVEGFMVDEGISFAHLKGVLSEFLHRLYGKEKKVRFRPSFFPFTEPSAEVDVECVVCGGKGCRVCKSTGWLEVLGCGMIHPYLFGVVGYDKEKYSGFAFGMGVERLAMIKYAIDDIRLLYEGNMTFLEQF